MFYFKEIVIMSKKAYIKKAIVDFVSNNSAFYVDYTNWYVGITNDVYTRLSKHESNRGKEIKIFRHWEAETARIAADLEMEFLNAGMNGSHGGWAMNSYFIYVYKFKGPGA
jgi:GIY-YIG catalytic domain